MRSHKTNSIAEEFSSDVGTIWTARIDYRGADRLDITVKGRDPLGSLLAPTWSLVAPYIEKRREKRETDADWMAYCEQYVSLLRKRWMTERVRFDDLLARLQCQSVTLVCYCTDVDRCHRSVAARVLQVASDWDYRYLGERDTAPKLQSDSIGVR